MYLKYFEKHVKFTEKLQKQLKELPHTPHLGSLLLSNVLYHSLYNIYYSHYLLHDLNSLRANCRLLLLNIFIFTANIKDLLLNNHSMSIILTLLSYCYLICN